MSRTSTAVLVLVLTLAQANGAWVDVTGQVPGEVFLIASVPGQDKVVVGCAGEKGMWATTDGGANWDKLATGAGSAQVTCIPTSIVFDPEDSDIFWISGMYGPGVLKTTDGGSTFTRLGDISHSDGVSVDLTDPARMTLLAGGHEQKRNLRRSTDGGQTWENVGANLPEDSHFSSCPLVIDSQTYLVACAGWGDGTYGIHRTTDGGATWEQVSDLGPVGPPLVTSKGVVIWALIWDRGIVASANQGGRWVQSTQWGVVKMVTPIEMPDGRIVALQYGTRNLVVSANGGNPWNPIGEACSVEPGGVAYSPRRQAFFAFSSGRDRIYRLDYAAPTSVRTLSGVRPAGRTNAERAVVRVAGSSIRIIGTDAVGSQGLYDLRGCRVGRHERRSVADGVYFVNTAQ
jgi:photosystem II stability/assembly factor-like uncharacterized protein